MIEVLKKSRDLILSGYCKGAIAKDVEGKNVSAIDPRARLFCAGGAVLRACWDLDLSSLAGFDILLYLGKFLLPNTTLSQWNDEATTTATDVIALFDNAIATLEKEKKLGEEA